MDPPSIVKEEYNCIEFESVILSKVTGFWQKTEKVKIMMGDRKGLLRFSSRGRVLTQSKSNLSEKGMRGEMRRGRGMSKYWEDEEG